MDTELTINRRRSLQVAGLLGLGTVGLASAQRESIAELVGGGSRRSGGPGDLEDDHADRLADADDYSAMQFHKGWKRWISGSGNVRRLSRTDRDGSVLEVTYEGRGFRGGTMFTYMDDHHGYEPDAAHARSWVYFPADWEFHSNGGGTKLPGFAGTYGRAGWGGRESDGTNGWSARMYVADSGGPRDSGPIRVGSQIYHADDTGQHGDHSVWETTFERGTWHQIDQYVAMNTPGEPDGVYRGWIDGELGLDRDDLLFRAAGYGEEIAIQMFRMSFYYGGTWGSPKAQKLYYDDVEFWAWESVPR